MEREDERPVYAFFKTKRRKLKKKSIQSFPLTPIESRAKKIEKGLI